MTGSPDPTASSALLKALQSTGTTLDTHSPLLSQSLSLLVEFSLTPLEFARKWDAVRYQSRLKSLDDTALAKLRDAFANDREKRKFQSTKKGEKINLTHSTNSRGRVRTKDNLLDILNEDGMLGDIMGVNVKKEEMIDESTEDSVSASEPAISAMTLTADAVAKLMMMGASTSSDSGSAVPVVSSTSQSSTSMKSSSIPKSEATSSVTDSKAGGVSKYAQRANIGKIESSYNEALAPVMTLLTDTSTDADTRNLQYEYLPSVGEIDDNEARRPMRFMYVTDEEFRDSVSDRIEYMQHALIGSHDYQQLCRVMTGKPLADTDANTNTNTATDASMESKEETKEAPLVKDTEMKSDDTANKNDRGDTSLIDDFDSIDLDDIGLSSTQSRSQSALIVCGRVCVDANSDESKLTLTNLTLEGDRSLSLSHRIALRLSLINAAYSLFPGQIVLAKGTNTTGLALVAESLITAAPPPPLTLSMTQVTQYNTGSRPLCVMTAAGPFTSGDDLLYEPLFDLIIEANRYRADMLILQGPFIDVDHPSIKSGSTSSVDKLFAGLLDELDRQLNSHTVLVIQPSTRDAHHLSTVYPQPPYDTKRFGGSRRKNWHFVSNPATVRINDCVIGLSSLDVLSQLSQSEINGNGVGGKRLLRLAGHCVGQQSYCPVFPIQNDSEAIDYAHQPRFAMSVRPSLLLLPSSLARFTGDVGYDSVGVNSGALCKGSTGGCYGLVTLHPKSEFELTRDRETESRITEHLVKQRLRCDLVRI